ncbi:MAG: MmgE/PrpD family protein [Candidatus Lindowbacteria bacterium]|nr:MmgE/PrpD family protein [Candidatus Lindowbacteria bacterium]
MERATRMLAVWAQALNYEDIPRFAVKQAKDQVFGLLAAGLAATTIAPGKTLLAAVKSWGDKRQATVWGARFKSSARSAAFANLVLAQLLEFEDAITPYSHVGAAIIPTALAVGEVEKCSGKQLIEAIVVGNEVGGRVGYAAHRGIRMGNAIPVYQVTVPFVAGKLMRLDLDTYLDGIGGALAQVQVTLLSGWVSHSKTYLSAMPVLAGVTAMSVARGGGFTGFHEPLEDPLGYITLVCERPIYEALIAELGKVWWTERLVSKAYPVCGWTLAQVEAAIDLAKENDIDPNQIKEVIVKVPTQAAMAGTMWLVDKCFENLRTRHDWTYIPLLFELTYPVAAAIVDRELTPRQWTEERLFDPLIHDVIKKIRCEADIMLTSAYVNESKLGAVVTINMSDGRLLEKTIPTVKGAPSRPYDVAEKFRTQAIKIRPKKKVEQAIEMIRNLETVDDVTALCKLL